MKQPITYSITKLKLNVNCKVQKREGMETNGKYMLCVWLELKQVHRAAERWSLILPLVRMLTASPQVRESHLSSLQTPGKLNPLVNSPTMTFQRSFSSFISSPPLRFEKGETEHAPAVEASPTSTPEHTWPIRAQSCLLGLRWRLACD